MKPPKAGLPANYAKFHVRATGFGLFEEFNAHIAVSKMPHNRENLIARSVLKTLGAKGAAYRLEIGYKIIRIILEDGRQADVMAT